MVIGTVKGVDSTGVRGTVSPNDSDETYVFGDTNFPNTGLSVGDPCMFDLECFGLMCRASNVLPVSVTKRVINSDLTENLTIGQMDEVIIKGSATLTGDVTINGGELKVKDNSTVNGKVDINDGGFAMFKDGVVTGAITVNKSRIKLVNGTAQSDVTMNGDGELISKSGGMVNGAITVNKGDVVKLVDNSQAGSIDVQGEEVDLVVKTGGMVNGAITVHKPNKIKID